MKKLNKILPRIAVGILILVLVTTLILSSVYAKYVSKPETNPMNLRPAAMLVMINTPRDDKIKVNFAADLQKNVVPAANGASNGDFAGTLKMQYGLTLADKEVERAVSVRQMAAILYRRLEDQ